MRSTPESAHARVSRCRANCPGKRLPHSRETLLDQVTDRLVTHDIVGNPSLCASGIRSPGTNTVRSPDRRDGQHSILQSFPGPDRRKRERSLQPQIQNVSTSWSSFLQASLTNVAEKRGLGARGLVYGWDEKLDYRIRNESALPMRLTQLVSADGCLSGNNAMAAAETLITSSSHAKISIAAIKSADQPGTCKKDSNWDGSELAGGQHWWNYLSTASMCVASSRSVAAPG